MIHHLHEALTQGTVSEDEAHGRIYAWVPGVVTDIDTKLYQIKARLGRIADNESTDWISQMGMGGMESLPEVGDIVGVTFADGDVHRGAFFCFPQSNSKGRPTECMVLGTSLSGLLNQLVTDVQTLVTAYLIHKHVETGGTTSVPDTLVFQTNIPPGSLNTGKCQSADGGVVAPKSGNQKVLSKRGRLR